jgi:LDH2 family malate/lactate/ureidoglycolate dehydrogenase
MSGTTDGVLIVAINIAAFCDRANFQRQMGLLVRHVKSSATPPGGFEVLVPGESEHNSRMYRLRDGIPIDDGTCRQLATIIDELGLPSFDTI